MENKKSFVLYCDLLHTVNKLPNDKAGELFKHLLEYVNDLEPQTEDLLIEVAFEGIKQSLKRDLQKYLNIVDRNKSNGSKGGRPKKPKKPTGLLGNPKKPKKADSDSVNDNDSVNEIYSINDILKEKETLNALLKVLNISKLKVTNYFNEFSIQYLTDKFTHTEYKDKLTHFINYVKKQEKDIQKENAPEIGINGKYLGQAPKPLT